MQKRSQRSVLLVLLALFALLAFSQPTSTAADFVCGDFNDSGAGADVEDLVFLVHFMFLEGPSPDNLAAADANGDGRVDVSDLVAFVKYAFALGSRPTCGLIVHEDIPGQCVGDFAKSPGDSPGTMYAEAIGHDLHIYHLDAYYNCCIGYDVEYHIDGFNITAIEHDTLDACDCYCPFNLETVLYDLDDGEYIVTLINAPNAPIWPGDTIGIDTVIIPGPALTRFEHIGCLELKYDPVDPTEEIIYAYFDGTLALTHLNAYFNCVAIFEMDFEIVEDTIRFIERNISTEAVYCLCYYNLLAAVDGITPGNYVAEVWAQYYPEEDVVLVDRQELILLD